MQTFLNDFYQGRVESAQLQLSNYRVMQCHQCDLLYQSEILNPEGLNLLYNDWVDQSKSLQKKRSASSKLFKQYAGQMQSLQALFAARPADIRVLDYGMGWGYWARLAQAHGFDVSGVELSKQRAEHARGMGLLVLDSLPAEGGQYHFIYANQVFEHLTDPRQAMFDLSRSLLPDGVMHIRVPDGRGIAANLRQRGWSGELGAIHPLEHINCFSRASLKYLAGDAGMEVINPPLRLHRGSLIGGMRREIADRFFTTHLYLRKRRREA